MHADLSLPGDIVIMREARLLFVGLVALALAGCSDNGAGYRADLFCSPGTAAADAVKLDRAELSAGAKEALDECADQGSARIVGLDARGLYVAGPCCQYEWDNVTVTAQFTVP